MGELGLCSRREADRWIESGWVKVDGQVVDTLGVRVSPNARIEIDRAAREHQSGQVTILLHKPVGYVSGQAEDGYEPAIVLIRPENRWTADPSPIQFQREHLRSLVPAGRLDIDSTGLLVLTQDGRVAKQLIGENSSVEKEYLVRVEGDLSPDGMKRLQYGLTLDGVKLKPAQVSLLELCGRGIRRPAILRADQHDGGLVAVLGLAGDIAHWLVQQDGDLSALVLACGAIDLDARIG